MSSLPPSFNSKNPVLATGYSYKVDNSPSQQELGIQYRKLEDPLLDHAAQIIKDGLV